MFAVIHRAQKIRAPQFGQLACIDLVTLVPNLQKCVLARIAHQHLIDVRPQQIVQPRGPSSFLQRDM